MRYCFEICFVSSFDGNHWDSHALSFGVKSSFLVEFFDFADSFIVVLLVFKRADSNVCEAVCAKDNLRSLPSFCSKGNSCKKAWTESCWTCLFKFVEFAVEVVMSLTNWLTKVRLGLLLSIFEQEIIVRQFISSNNVRILSSVSNDGHFIVKSDKSYSSLWIFILHDVNLRLNSCLHALESRNICHVFIFERKLIRSIWELHEILKFGSSVSFDFELSSHRFCNSHRTWDVNAENNRDFFFGFLFVFFCLCVFKNIIDGIFLWNLLIHEDDKVPCVAKLTDPDLLVFELLRFNFFFCGIWEFWIHVEDGFAWFAKSCISCHYFRILF